VNALKRADGKGLAWMPGLFRINSKKHGQGLGSYGIGGSGLLNRKPPAEPKRVSDAVLTSIIRTAGKNEG
jgi:hypothetical protein